MRQTKSLISIHEQAKNDFSTIQGALNDERLQCVTDRRFYSIAGAMWEGKLGEQFINKPRLEINKIMLSIIRIINEYRANRITVDFVPKDGKADKLADTCNDLYRADEQKSDADEAYDNAFEEAVGGGFGAWRLRAKYEDEYDEENDKQKICIEPIYDADTSVYFDLEAQRYDKADAKYAFVLKAMTPQAYEDEWGDDPTSWDKEIWNTSYFDWCTPDVIYVCEYYKVDEISETVLIFKTIRGEEERYTEEDFENDPDLIQTLNATGTVQTGERKIKRRKIRKYIMSGSKVLEDCGYIVGKHIPLVPVYGKRWFIDNIERCMGHVRLSKDVQRLKNMQVSRLAEISALSTVEKPIFVPQQMSGHENMWAEDNIENFAYMLINTITDAQGNEIASPPVAYTKVPNIPPAMAALLQLTDNDIKEILGNQEQGEEVKTNMSGKAVELIQNRLDMQSAIYMTNMAKSVKRCGEIWLSMAQDLFVEEDRSMKTIGRYGDVGTLNLKVPKIDEETMEQYFENDLSRASFDVTVTVGPSSVSKRSATVRAVTGLLQLTQDPETVQILTSMALMNMEGEGIEDVKKFFRKKLIKLGVVEPTEQEMKDTMEELKNQPEDPNSIFLKAAAEEAQGKAAKSRADTILSIAKSEESKAKADESQAKTIEILKGIESVDKDHIFEAAKILGQMHEEGSLENSLKSQTIKEYNYD